MNALVDGWESVETIDGLEDLVGRGLVRIDRREVVLCDTFEREADGHFCGGWAEPGDPYGEAPACGTCGREIEDAEGCNALHTLVLDREAIVDALDAFIGGRRLRDGVAWSVEGDRDDVLVVVADWSDGTRWMTDRTLSGRPFVLVQVDEVRTDSRLAKAEWVVTVRLIDALRDPAALGEAVRQAEAKADVPRTEPTLVELHALRSRVVHVFHGTHMLELDGQEVRVDGMRLKLASGMRKVLGYLVDRHVDDSSAGKTPDAYCVWSLAEMSEAVGLPRTAVRTQLTRFQDRLASHHAETTHRRLAEGSVLECVDSQWRLNPNCLVRRSA